MSAWCRATTSSATVIAGQRRRTSDPSSSVKGTPAAAIESVYVAMSMAAPAGKRSMPPVVQTHCSPLARSTSRQASYAPAVRRT